MIINGKAAAKVMAAAWKEEYQVCGFRRGGETWLAVSGDGWCIAGQRNKLPREVLAKIVEHGGELPGAGEAFEVLKNMPNQLMDWELSSEWTLELLDQEVQSGLLVATRLKLRNRHLWQETETGKVWQMDPALTAMGTPAPDRIQPCMGWLRMMGDRSMVAVGGLRCMDGDEKLVEHLEKFRGL